MSIALARMIKALEARVSELEKKIVAGQTPSGASIGAETPVLPSATARAMCPHCGVKPNYFFHVKKCAEKNKNNDRRPDPGAT